MKTQKTVKPITPDEVVEKLQEEIPAKVIAAVNKLIATKWNGSQSRFDAVEICNMIDKLGEHDDLPTQNFPANFPPIYRKAGWDVEVDRPDYTECRSTFWTFTKSKL